VVEKSNLTEFATYLRLNLSIQGDDHAIAEEITAQRGEVDGRLGGSKGELWRNADDVLGWGRWREKGCGAIIGLD
jgi:hypothetical protein